MDDPLYMSLSHAKYDENDDGNDKSTQRLITRDHPYNMYATFCHLSVSILNIIGR